MEYQEFKVICNQIISLAKDPAENFDWNQDPDITY